MATLSPIDVGQIMNMILRENRGNVLTEALCVGIETAAVFYCNKIKDGAEKGLQLAEQEKEQNHA